MKAGEWGIGNREWGEKKMLAPRKESEEEGDTMLLNESGAFPTPHSPAQRTPHSPLKNIELQIEELVLHGFARKDQGRIQRAIEQELTRLFTEQGVPASLSCSQEIQQLPGGSFDVRAGMGVEAIGSQVAQAIYGGMGQ